MAIGPKFIATALIALTAAPMALAQGTTSWTYTRGNGETVTVERDVVRDGSGRTVTVTGETSTGKSWQRGNRLDFDRESKTWTLEGGGSTSGGKSWTSSGKTVCGEGGCTSRSEVAGSGGRKWTSEGEHKRLEPGLWESEITRTGPRGTRKITRRWQRIRRAR